MLLYTVAKEMLGMSGRTDSKSYSGVGFPPRWHNCQVRQILLVNCDGTYEPSKALELPKFDISVHREAPTYLPQPLSRIHRLRIGRRKPFLNSMLSHLTLLVSSDS